MDGACELQLTELSLNKKEGKTGRVSKKTQQAAEKKFLNTYRVRIKPQDEHLSGLQKTFGCKRYVYNGALTQKIKHYELTGKSLSRRAIQDKLVALKKEETTAWLNEVNSQSLLAALDDLEIAFDRFFKHGAGFPKFKKKYTGRQSFRCPQHVTVDFEQGVINLPKIKNIPAIFHRPFQGVVKSVTLIQEACGDYYASILVDRTQLMQPIEPLVVTSETTVGLDVGLTDFIIDSHGNKIPNPKFLKESLKALAVEQKKYALTKKGSHGQKKQKKVVATVHERIKNQRKNFIHQPTAMLVKSEDSMVVLEDLTIKGMIKNRKLSRAIADVGWGLFISILRSKCERSGKTLYQINRFAPTSKLCSECGHKMDSMPLSVRDWVCPSCGCHHDRDVNAAKNIQAIGLADVLGHSICVKSPRLVMPVSAGHQETKPKGAQIAVHGSQEKEAPTRIALAI